MRSPSHTSGVPPRKDFIAWQNDEIEGSIGQRFELQVERFPERTAIRSPQGHTSYAALRLLVNRFAGALSRRFAPGERVAILMDQETPLIAAILGTLKAGLVCVPLPPAHPEGRLAVLIEHADPQGLFTDASHSALAHRLAGDNRMVLDASLVEDVESAGTPEPQLAAGGSIAFILYTSGSTGTAKGVLQTHRNFLDQVRGYAHDFQITYVDRICLLASCSGAQGLSTVFCALLNGAGLCLRDLEHHGILGLSEWLEAERVSIFYGSASLFRHLARSLPGPGSLPCLRLVKVGAEPILPSDLASFRQSLPSRCVFANTLSSSETLRIAQHFIHPQDPLPEDGVPVGCPVSGKTVLLLDEKGAPVPPGEQGEICVHSHLLSPGYWRDPERTRRSFVPIPGTDRRLYRSGDLGRWRTENCLEHAGRKDNTVKIRGSQVNLSAVETALHHLPEVSRAVVLCDRPENGDTRLIACLEIGGGNADITELRKQLLRDLPNHMVPSQIVVFPAIPLSSNGKPDREYLRQEMHNRSRSGLGPRTPLERRISTAWEEVLPQAGVGVYDNFFAVGGDSLNALDLILALSKELRQNVPIELLLNYPSIALMAEALEVGFIPSRSKPWVRTWQASLLPLRDNGGATPVIFLPGGYGSENELLVYAGLGQHLGREYLIYGVRMNLAARRCLPPWTLQGMARRIGKAILRKGLSRTPVIIGECQASSLALATATWLARRLPSAPTLILLDPLQPRSKTTSLHQHPPAIARYYQLLRQYAPSPYQGITHLVCAAESGRLANCLSWWSDRIGSHCQGHLSPGNHHTYIRQHRKDLAAILDGILATE